MKSGKSYWSLSINQDKVWDELVLTKKDSTRRDLMLMSKYIRISIKAQLNEKLDYSTEAEAKEACAKLDSATRKFVSIYETTPVNLGLGWC
jgi:hypothetical protein